MGMEAERYVDRGPLWPAESPFGPCLDTIEAPYGSEREVADVCRECAML